MVAKRTKFIFLLIASGCSHANLWTIDGIAAGNPTFDSTRLRYHSPQHRSPLAFEMVRMGTHIEAFLSLTRFRLIPAEDSTHAKVTFTIGNQTHEELIPIHEGQMRLRIPLETTQKLIEALQAGQKVAILLDGFEETLDPDQFSSSFAKFLGSGNFFKNLFKGPEI